jgi:hypothetical protein
MTLNRDTSISLREQNTIGEKKRIVEQLQNMPIVEISCKRAGVARATYYRWLKKDPEFATKCMEALEQSTGAVNDIAEAKLISAIQEGNMTAISFWLRSRHQAYQTKVNIQGTINHRTEVLSDEQSQLVERALWLAGLIEYKENEDE